MGNSTVLREERTTDFLVMIVCRMCFSGDP